MNEEGEKAYMEHTDVYLPGFNSGGMIAMQKQMINTNDTPLAVFKLFEAIEAAPILLAFQEGEKPEYFRAALWAWWEIYAQPLVQAYGGLIADYRMSNGYKYKTPQLDAYNNRMGEIIEILLGKYPKDRLTELPENEPKGKEE